MELGLQKARIIDYGMSKTKNDIPQIFIDFNVGGEVSRWYGFPLKKTGEVNNVVMQQLATAGFDLRRDLNCIGLGLHAQCFTIYKDIDVNVKEKTNNVGNLYRCVDSIGLVNFGSTQRMSVEELGALFTSEQLAMFKSFADKFQAAGDPNEEVPL